MNTFKELGLPEKVLAAIEELGFETPTPVQQNTIPILLQENTDIISLAQTGTGKTAAFGLPLIAKIDANSRHPRALILAPTRELCVQIAGDLKKFSSHVPTLKIATIYGGASIGKQLSELESGAQIIVATPGRMVDVSTRKSRILDEIEIVVLDEADEMLNMGFKDELDSILSKTPKEKNTWLFSATMPQEVLRISKNYMRNPIELSAGEKNVSNQNIKHIFYVVQAKDKYLALKRIADYYPEIFAIVFCRTKIETQQIAEQLIKDGYNADALHGDLSQQQRDMVMKRYRNRALQMLVATDVAARGIDVNDVTHVINYNLPDELESYTHRSGRTARAGKKGISIAIINMKEIGKVKILERLTKAKFTKALLPQGEEVVQRQLLHFIDKIKKTSVDSSEIENFVEAANEKLAALSKEEIIEKLVATELRILLDYYRNTSDLNVTENNGGGNREKLFISLGILDGFNNKNFKSYLADETGIDEKNILWVDVKKSFSFVEIKPESAEQFTTAFHNKNFKGRKINVEISSGRTARERKEGKQGSFKDKEYGQSRGRDFSSKKTRFEPQNNGHRRSEKKSNTAVKSSTGNESKKSKKMDFSNFNLDAELQRLFDTDNKSKKRKG